MMMKIFLAVFAVLAAPFVALAQNSDDDAAPGRVIVPFAVGEQLVYDAKFGAIKVGTARMQVADITTLRGREAWHTVFGVSGGTFFYRI